MAMNQQEAQKAERKLRPLYDAVDNGQNKKAIQLADKILKKNDDLHCARTLKAIALLRAGRQDESVNAIKTVLSSHPGDQATLQACTMYFKENGEYSRIAELYADAALHYPKNQDILTHLFMAYVRVGDYQKQQQTAVELHKAFPKSGPYYCWRVMSILMQASDSKNDDKAKQLFLPLAERLIDKYFAESDVDSEAEVKLYLMVLDKLEKTEKRLRILEGPPGKKLKYVECLGFQVNCLISLKRWDRAVEILTELVEKMPDQWCHMQQFISCQIIRCQGMRKIYEELASEAREKELQAVSADGKENEGYGDVSSPEEDDPSFGAKSGTVAVCGDDTSSYSWTNLNGSENFLHPLHEARDLIEKLAMVELAVGSAAKRTRYIVRGPLLARMELIRQLFHNGMHFIPLNLVSPKDMLSDYFRFFGTKDCVFDDLRVFLDLFGKINNQSVLHFLQQVQEQVNLQAIDFDCPDNLLKENVDRMRSHVNLLQLQRYHGCLPFSDEQLLGICRHNYQEGIKLGRQLVSSVNQPADFYAILATHILLQKFQESYDISVLWEAIFILEKARNINPQISFLLMHCYGIIGANENMTNLFEAVSIKHLQMETIGYTPMRYIQSMGTFGFANQLYKNELRFYYSVPKEFSEYIIQAYKNGTFSMIEQFVECRDRLTHSFNFVNTLTEMNILDMILSVNSISQARDFFKKDWIPKIPLSFKDYVNSLMDNRDLSVLDDWSPLSEQLAESQKKSSFELERLWLRTRLNLVESLGEAVSLVTDIKEKSGSDVEVDGREMGLVLLVKKVEEYRSTLEVMDHHEAVIYLRTILQRGSKVRLPLQHPPPCLGYFFLQQGHGQIIFDMLRVTIRMAEGQTQLENLLKDILRRVEAVKCQIRPVPDELRQSLSKMMNTANPCLYPSIISSEDTSYDHQREIEPSPLDHPYDIISRSRIELETYVLLLQTISQILLLSMVCAEFLAPSMPKEEGKKKNKRKKAPSSTPITTSVAANQLRDFVSEIHQTLTILCQQFHPLPLPDDEDEMVLRLKHLYVGKEEDISPEQVKERKMMSRVCGTTLTSYDMSLRDTMQLASSKLNLASSLILRFGTASKHVTPS